MDRLTFHDGDITGVVKNHDRLSSDDIGQLAAKLAYCVSTARSWIKTVGKKEYLEVRNDLQLFFKDSTHSTFSIVCEKINVINNGLSQPVTVKFDDIGNGHQGLTRKSINPFSRGQTRILLNTSSFLRSVDDDYWALVYLHEATHLFANTEDYAYVNYGNLTYETEITSLQALSNADSYAAYIYNICARHTSRMLRSQDGVEQ